MLGLMQDQPLLISSLIEFAERHNGDGEIVSRRVEGDIHRSSWRQIASRARQVANALCDASPSGTTLAASRLSSERAASNCAPAVVQAAGARVAGGRLDMSR